MLSASVILENVNAAVFGGIFLCLHFWPQYDTINKEHMFGDEKTC